MRARIMVFAALPFLACEKTPVNPPRVPAPVPRVTVRCTAVQYVPVEHAVDGLIAKKMNVLTFSVRCGNVKAKAVEFFGSVRLQGPPYNREHDLHFFTDRLDAEAVSAGSAWTLLGAVHSDSTYTLVRCKFPMNEYAPFEGDQGKVIGVRMQRACAYSELGESVDLEVVDETE